MKPNKLVLALQSLSVLLLAALSPPVRSQTVVIDSAFLWRNTHAQRYMHSLYASDERISDETQKLIRGLWVNSSSSANTFGFHDRILSHLNECQLKVHGGDSWRYLCFHDADGNLESFSSPFWFNSSWIPKSASNARHGFANYSLGQDWAYSFNASQMLRVASDHGDTGAGPSLWQNRSYDFNLSRAPEAGAGSGKISASDSLWRNHHDRFNQGTTPECTRSGKRLNEIEMAGVVALRLAAIAVLMLAHGDPAYEYPPANR